jgi:molybdopterin synthase catalytic subunit
MEFCDIKLTRDPIDSPVSRYSQTEGAIVDFFGVVRSVEEQRIIEGINYEAFEEMALHRLTLIATEARDQYGLAAVTLWHRIGFVPAGQVSLFVRVTAAHRRAAFDGCSQIIEKLKIAVPVWKHPIFVNVPTSSIS